MYYFMIHLSFSPAFATHHLERLLPPTLPSKEGAQQATSLKLQ